MFNTQSASDCHSSANDDCQVAKPNDPEASQGIVMRTRIACLVYSVTTHSSCMTPNELVHTTSYNNYCHDTGTHQDSLINNSNPESGCDVTLTKATHAIEEEDEVFFEKDEESGTNDIEYNQV